MRSLPVVAFAQLFCKVADIHKVHPASNCALAKWSTTSLRLIPNRKETSEALYSFRVCDSLVSAIQDSSFGVEVSGVLV